MIRQLGIDRVHLVAHDFGGPFAAAWAADHPGNVASVTFLNTGVLVGYRWHRMARIWRTPVLGELSMRALNPRTMATVLARENPGLPKQWVHTIVGHLMPAKTRRAVLRLYRSTRPADSISWRPGCVSATIDALVVFGDADCLHPRRAGPPAGEVFPRAEIRMLPGVGHWCWLEATDAVAAEVVPFLRERVGGST